MYCTTLGVRPCRDSVMSTSAALLRHGTLCTGHQLVIALNSSVKSSLRASSSAGDGRLHRRTNTCAQRSTNHSCRLHSRTNNCAHSSINHSCRLHSCTNTCAQSSTYNTCRLHRSTKTCSEQHKPQLQTVHTTTTTTIILRPSIRDYPAELLPEG